MRIKTLSIIILTICSLVHGLMITDVQFTLLVLHNVQPHNAAKIFDILPENSAFTLSLRHDTAIKSLEILLNHPKRDKFIIGASTVSSSIQVKHLQAHNIDFLSTMEYHPEVLSTAKDYQLPVLCGCSSYTDAKLGLQNGAWGLKFYPSTKVSPDELLVILSQLNMESILTQDNDYTVMAVTTSSFNSSNKFKTLTKRFHSVTDTSTSTLSSSHSFSSTTNTATTTVAGVPIFVAGGLTLDTIPYYLYNGASHFCVGVNFDEVNVPINNLYDKMIPYNQICHRYYTKHQETSDMSILQSITRPYTKDSIKNDNIHT